MEKFILRVLALLGFALVVKVIRKDSLRDWVIIFLLKGFLASFIDAIMTNKNLIKYPVRFMPQYFRINILFDYLLFPIMCVLFNQMTFQKSPKAILLISFILTIPMTAVEVILESKTKLITFKNGWKWYYTFISETLAFLFSRVFIAFVRKQARISIN